MTARNVAASTRLRCLSGFWLVSPPVRGGVSENVRYWFSRRVEHLQATTGCGVAGYNPPGNATHHGPAGAYCCGGSSAAPCPTCFFANAALAVVKNGVECYAKLGVPASKLVLAFPWYGCVCNTVVWIHVGAYLAIGDKMVALFEYSHFAVHMYARDMLPCIHIAELRRWHGW
jgi:hypothetical protein